MTSRNPLLVRMRVALTGTSPCIVSCAVGPFQLHWAHISEVAMTCIPKVGTGCRPLLFQGQNVSRSPINALETVVPDPWGKSLEWIT